MRPALMDAAVILAPTVRGEWNALGIEQVPRPVLREGEALIQVEACSVNRADLLQRRGLYPPPPGASDIPGLDFSGYIVEMTAGVEGWRIGDRVLGITAGGGYGRYVAVPASHLVPIPTRLSFVEAAAVAEVFFTAFVNLFMEAGLRAGERVLIHGGGSGVGTAAIQLCRAAGVEAIVTVGAREKRERCLQLGASHTIVYKEEDFGAGVLDLTSGDGVEVVLDCIGAPYLDRHLRILKTGGRLVLIGLMGGSKSEIALDVVLTRRLHIIGSVLRSRSDAEKAVITDRFKDHVLPLLASGAVKPVIDRVFAMTEVELAHERMQAGEHFGKIVLTWGQ
ncbi:MAG: NAD(P)H-quinone oxidoreductase [Syntrophobacteraceae bacterium]